MSTIEKLLGADKRKIWTILPSDSVYDAIKKMSEKSIGALPVVDGDKLVGIISERDYARKIILDNRSSRETLVKEIMTSKVFYIKPEQKIEESMTLMTEHRIRHLPVVDEGRLVGMISVGDVVKYIISNQKFKIEQLENTLSWGENY